MGSTQARRWDMLVPKPLTARQKKILKAAKTRLAKDLPLTEEQERVVEAARRRADVAAFVRVAAALPIGLMQTITGRQQKQLQDLAKAFQVPCGGTPVDLLDTVRILVELVTMNASRIGRTEEEIDSKRAKEMAQARAAHATADKREREVAEIDRVLVRLGEVRLFHQRIAASYRRLADMFGRKASIEGKQAQRLLNDVVKRHKKELGNLKSKD